MFRYETMHMAVAGRCEYDRLAGERPMVDQIEQMFERASVRAAVDWCGNDQRVGSLDRPNDGLAGSACLGAGQAGKNHRRRIGHFDKGQPLYGSISMCVRLWGQTLAHAGRSQRRLLV